MPDSNNYVVAAYVVTWIMLLGYALRLHAVSRRSREQYAEASRSHEAGQS